MSEKKITLKKIISLIPAFLFLLFIYYMMIRTYTGTVKETVDETKPSTESLMELSDSFEEVLQENFYDKNNYINLNGLVVNALGINTLNERQKLANGQLDSIMDSVDTSEASEKVIKLNDFLSERDIDFVYLLAPSKSAFYDAEFLPGYSSNASETLDTMFNSLNDAGVATIDIDAWYEENGWTMDEVFFKTDTHWLPSAALAAAGVTMEYLSDEGLANYDEELLDSDSWDIVTLEDWFLGNHGKRVGIYYAGVDDIDVYLPKFETGYSFSGLHANTTDWQYSDNPLDLSYMEEKDYFDSDPNCTYLYANNPIQIITNTEAVNDKRVLVIGDSYRRAWEYFMTTQFTEIYSCDTRYYTDGNLAEFIEEIQPDIVIMCTYSNAITNEDLYTFGVDEYLAALDATSESDAANVISLGDFEVKAKEDKNTNHIEIYSDLEPNQAYTLTLDSTSYTGGDDMYIQMTIKDLSTEKPIYNRYFDANSDEAQKWIFTTPDDAEAEYVIYLYAGTKGHTENVSVEVTGVELQKGIFE